MGASRETRVESREWLQDQLAELDHLIRTQNLIAREERKILQRWKDYAFKIEAISARLANHLMHCGHDENSSSSLRDWKALKLTRTPSA